MAEVFDYTFKGITDEALNGMGEVELLSDSKFNSASGFHKRLKAAVNLAIYFIVAEEDAEWSFLKDQTGSQVLTIGDNTYAAPASIEIDWESFFIQRDAALDLPDAQDLTFIAWERYRDQFRQRDNNDVTTDAYDKPNIVTRDPENNIVITRKPDAAYTLSFTFSGIPTSLQDPSDIPIIPQHFKDVLLWGIMWYGYIYREDAESASKAEDEFIKGINRMRRILIQQNTTARMLPQGSSNRRGRGVPSGRI